MVKVNGKWLFSKRKIYNELAPTGFTKARIRPGRNAAYSVFNKANVSG